MKLSTVERAMLENQRAIMIALVYQTRDGRKAIEQRLKTTDKLLVVKPVKRRRKLPRNTGAFSSDVGDQGY